MTETEEAGAVNQIPKLNFLISSIITPYIVLF